MIWKFLGILFSELILTLVGVVVGGLIYSFISWINVVDGIKAFTEFMFLTMSGRIVYVIFLVVVFIWLWLLTNEYDWE